MRLVTINHFHIEEMEEIRLIEEKKEKERSEKERIRKV
jgi:hypothetical protein